MTATVNWQASPLEQRIAWGVATCCMILVLLASARPEWFAATRSIQKQVVRHAQATHPKHQAKPRRHAHVKAPPKSHAAHPVTQRPIHPKASPPAPAVKTAAVASGYYVQLGAFHEHPRAQGLADQLKRHGWHAVIAPTQGGLHAVWIGPKQTRDAAETLLKTIQRKSGNKGFIVHHA